MTYLDNLSSIQHLPYLLSEGCWREGLLQEVNARFKDTVMDNGIVRITIKIVYGVK